MHIYNTLRVNNINHLKHSPMHDQHKDPTAVTNVKSYPIRVMIAGLEKNQHLTNGLQTITRQPSTLSPNTNTSSETHVEPLPFPIPSQNSGPIWTWLPKGDKEQIMVTQT